MKIRAVLAFTLSALFVLAGCEHFRGQLLDPGEWIEFPEIVGTWDVPRTTDPPVRIEKASARNEYRLIPRPKETPALLRFARVKGRIIGEYRDIKDGKAADFGYIFRIEKNGPCFLVYVGQEITIEMVNKYKLNAVKDAPIRGSSPSYVLNGTAAQNRKALNDLVEDPGFFPAHPGVRICPANGSAPQTRAARPENPAASGASLFRFTDVWIGRILRS